jgi:hypothetical protein
VRDLLVDYLQERQPALDHISLDHLAQSLGRRFWQDLERHHPGINTLHLPQTSPPRGNSGSAPRPPATAALRRRGSTAATY